jgi:hypothetical protein
VAAVAARIEPAAVPLRLDDERSYADWRARKLAHAAPDAASVTVDVADPRKLTRGERQALLRCIARCNLALYRSPVVDEDKDLPRALGAQLGLQRLDANWLADEDGVSSIQVSTTPGERRDFIPYTNQPIRWHTDGYYHPGERRIHGMILHCVRPAAQGGVNRLLDHERVYIALRDEAPALAAALARPDAMTIPARHDGDGVARPAQTGPVFSVAQGALHMRYTARTRSIEWHPDALVQQAAQRLAELLDSGGCGLLSLRLQPGMGLVCHNVLHDRSAFVDAPARPRLLYRARFLDRAAPPQD